MNHNLLECWWIFNFIYELEIELGGLKGCAIGTSAVVYWLCWYLSAYLYTCLYSRQRGCRFHKVLCL